MKGSDATAGNAIHCAGPSGRDIRNGWPGKEREKNSKKGEIWQQDCNFHIKSGSYPLEENPTSSAEWGRQRRTTVEKTHSGRTYGNEGSPRGARYSRFLKPKVTISTGKTEERFWIPHKHVPNYKQGPKQGGKRRFRKVQNVETQ